MTRPMGIVDLPIKDSVILYSLRTVSLSEVISEDITGLLLFFFGPYFFLRIYGKYWDNTGISRRNNSVFLITIILDMLFLRRWDI